MGGDSQHTQGSPLPTLPRKGGGNRKTFNSWDALKIIALLLMFIDHAGAFFWINEEALRSIGRGSAPIFLFLAGYASSYRFSWELLILACLMTLSNILMGEYFHPLNILFTILLCRAVFAWMQKRGRVIERPFEWFLSLAVFTLISCFIVQYGTFGLMFAASGYMNRRPERYTLKVRQSFLIATLVVYAAAFVLLFSLTPLGLLIMLPVLYADYWLLSRFTIRTIDTSRIPAWLVTFLTLSAHYSGYIYAIHLIILSWITRYPI